MVSIILKGSDTYNGFQFQTSEFIKLLVPKSRICYVRHLSLADLVWKLIQFVCEYLIALPALCPTPNTLRKAILTALFEMGVFSAGAAFRCCV